MHCVVLHDVLCTRACSDTGNFSTDALSDNRVVVVTLCDCMCINIDDFLTGGLGNRGLAVHHVAAVHENFSLLCILMVV